jgi:hypothetical protein
MTHHNLLVVFQALHFSPPKPFLAVYNPLHPMEIYDIHVWWARIGPGKLPRLDTLVVSCFH